MSLDYYFAVERPQGGVWVPARDAVREPDPHDPEHRACFSWLHRRHPGVALFTQGPLKLSTDLPPDSPLVAYYAPWTAELRLRWSPIAELLIDAWAETRVLLEAEAPVELAARFGSGEEPYPLDDPDALPGWPTIAHRPCEHRFGPLAHRRETSPPGRTVPVTWSASIAEVLGPSVTADFEHVQAVQPDGRVICYYA